MWIDNILQQIKKEGHLRTEMTIWLEIGKELPVEAFAWHFMSEGIGMFCIEILDISERRAFEAERKAAIEQIQKNMAGFSILNDGIRNPLSVILGIAEESCPDKFVIIEEQINQIDQTIYQLDNRWMQSDKILAYLKKHHGIEIQNTDEFLNNLEKE
jgi:hypothetical protein